MDYQEFLESKQLSELPQGKACGPIHSALFDFQAQIVAWAVNLGRAAIWADVGMGKALSCETNILTPSGYKRMGDIHVGEYVIGSNGKPTTVTGVFHQGIRPAYRMTFSDGYSVTCDEDHLWSVRTSNHKKRGQVGEVLTAREILENGVRSSGRWKWFIPMVEPIHFEGKELPLHPYLVGALIGDGGLSRQMPYFSSADDDLLERISNLLPVGVSLLKQTTGYDWRITTGKRNGRKKNPNPVTAALRNLGLMGTKSGTKFIPEIYKFASLEDRIELLRGLMDTDGYASKDNNISYCTVSKQLAEDFVFLVQSLGGKTRIRTKKTTGQLAYQMSVSLPNEIVPFFISRKCNIYRPRTKYPPMRAIVSIEPCAPTDMVCISVDANDSLYVVDHCIVTHNTIMQGEIARQLNEKTLFVAPLAVAHQTVRQLKELLGMELVFVRSQEEVGEHQFCITNYDIIHKFDASVFGTVILDESSILKQFSGVTKKLLVEMFADTPYRIALTATPSPNDILELGNHAQFLGIMSSAEMTSRFFIHKGGEGGTTNTYRLKKHSKEAFYSWVASWAVALRKPSDIGDFSDEGYDLPAKNLHLIAVDGHYTPEGLMPGFHVGSISATDAKKVRRKTIAPRAQVVADMVNESDAQWIIWTALNEEAETLNALIPDSINIHGSLDADVKVRGLLDFAEGHTRVLITKTSIAGMGLNLQQCHNMIFFGIDYSWEAYYQAEGRICRYGQAASSVNIYVVISEQERAVYEVVERKGREAKRMTEALVSVIKSHADGSHRPAWDYSENKASGHNWEIWLGDSCQRMKEIPDNSVGLSISSPPFANLYIYSPSERDLGNCRDVDEFMMHYDFIIRETLRVVQPGRLCAIHIQDGKLYENRDGQRGIYPLSDRIVQAYINAGWIYRSRITIDKNPQLVATRNKDTDLLFVTGKRDSTDLAPMNTDYILLFKKPGDNAAPVQPYANGEMSEDEWIEWAHAIWYDIRETDVLNNFPTARDNEDERHICPLQLGLISRVIRMYSNKGDVVFSPFAGVGSELYEAVLWGRFGFGIELKPSYWKTAQKNLHTAELKTSQLTLWDVKPALEASHD